MPYNTFGISYPAISDKSLITPSKLHLEYGFLQHKPFYRETWFMVALAATSIIIIITIIAILCVKSKSYKYKRKYKTVFNIVKGIQFNFFVRRSTKDVRRINGYVNGRSSGLAYGLLSLKKWYSEYEF